MPLKYLYGADYKKASMKDNWKARNVISLEKALKKVYTIKSYNGKTFIIPVPKCLKGKKVKLILLGGNNNAKMP